MTILCLPFNIFARYIARLMTIASRTYLTCLASDFHVIEPSRASPSSNWVEVAPMSTAPSIASSLNAHQAPIRSLKSQSPTPPLRQSEENSSSPEFQYNFPNPNPHRRPISESLSRYLDDHSLPVPFSKFSQLEVEGIEIFAQARMRAILEEFDL
ncbi:hypothetical protein OIDMADRAFT_19771 [Oidiodendron maius Zn]|uniref:Uncharacterized protein n=1 Tax=Oidiodendron maius (strain Zn) TaxID=913774 RepID=A0A0C3HBM8_OIDMZ|nr:hypothetical protein OIDMADRAFT_19771 [Oidiodendron maius Zn]